MEEELELQRFPSTAYERFLFFFRRVYKGGVYVGWYKFR